MTPGRAAKLRAPNLTVLPNRTAVRLSSLVLLALDTALILLAWGLSFWLRFNLDVPNEFSSMAVESALLAVGSYWVALLGMGVHRQVWRYIGFLSCVS